MNQRWQIRMNISYNGKGFSYHSCQIYIFEISTSKIFLEIIMIYILRGFLIRCKLSSHLFSFLIKSKPQLLDYYMEPKVYGIGNPLIDVVISSTDKDLKNLELSKGVMHLVDENRQSEIIQYFNKIFDQK